MKKRLQMAGLVFSLLIASAPAQVPALLNYQGRLVNGTNLFNGNVGLTLRLYNASAAGTLLYADSNTVAVVDGLYSTFIGDNTIAGDLTAALTNAQVWIETGVNGTALAPRERLASVAYAITAGGVSTGAITSAMLAQNGASAGQVLKWSGSAWAPSNDLTGSATLLSYAEAGTFSPAPVVSGTNAIAQGAGTSAQADYSVVGGGWSNAVGAGSTYAAIVGGNSNRIGTNSIASIIGGGQRNTIDSGTTDSFIGGGRGNEVGTNCLVSVVGGGVSNIIADNVDGGLICGGFRNAILGSADGVPRQTAPMIVGGSDNIISNSHGSIILGGDDNSIGTNAHYGVILGGNTCGIGHNASNSLAAGYHGKANHKGSFVWGDVSSISDTTSTSNNQVTFRAAGGFRIFSNPGMTLGATLPSGGTTWTALCDRNKKENIVPLDGKEVLARLAGVPICEWNYKDDPSRRRYYGPMAQDFHAAFGLGDDDTRINTGDLDGVALAAIQGLTQRLQEKDREIAELKSRLDALEARLGPPANLAP